MQRLPWLRLSLLGLFLLPVLTLLVALAIMPLRAAQIGQFLGGGVLTMALLGMALQDDGAGQPTARAPDS